MTPLESVSLAVVVFGIYKIARWCVDRWLEK